MSSWIKVASHDWRSKSHSLAYYDVNQYLNLDTGEQRFEYNGRLYVFDKSIGKYGDYKPYEYDASSQSQNHTLRKDRR